MRKSILFTIMSIVTIHSLFSQENREDKKLWVDLQFAQHIGLSKWSNVSYVNDGLPAASITELRGVLNYCLICPMICGFIDMGLGIMPAPSMKSFSIDRMPMPYNGTQYYLRETLSESGNSQTSANFKITTGLFTNFQVTEKLTILPYFGVGGLALSQRRSEVILKEQGSNMQYNTMYVWGHTNGGASDNESVMLGYLTGRLNFKYRISAKSSLLIGLEYTHFFNTLDFYGRYYNTFNGNVQRDFTVKGNNMNMLEISVGISFM